MGALNELKGDEPKKICRLDDLGIGQEYSFDPPLDIADVTILSEHLVMTQGKKVRRKPNFLKDALQQKGLKKGTLIGKGECKDAKTGTFRCTTLFSNTTTGQKETLTYTALCKFSSERVVGIEVIVRNLSAEVLGKDRPAGE